MRRFYAILAVLVLVVAAPAVRVQRQPTNWSDYGGAPDNARHVALDQITKANLSQLGVAWSYPSRDTMSYVFNPVVVDNVVYVLARNNSLVALEATTGKELWIHEDLRGIAPRGHQLLGEQGPLRPPAAVPDEQLPAGDRCPHGQVDHDVRHGRRGQPPRRTAARSGDAGEGAVVESRARCSRTSSSSGRPPAKTTWRRRATPRLRRRHRQARVAVPHHAASRRVRLRHVAEGRLEIRRRRQHVGRAHRSTRSAASPTSRPGSPTYDFYGADRHGANLFGTSLLALDARTGKRLWHFQMVHHDLWDYDNTAAPQLTTITPQRQAAWTSSRRPARPASCMCSTASPASRSGRSRSGRVPQSDMPGEKAWPTQPIPTAPPPFARQSLTAADINPYILTPRQRDRVEEAHRQRAQRRPLHAALVPRHRLDSRRARRRQLGHHGGRSGRRHRLRPRASTSRRSTS